MCQLTTYTELKVYITNPLREKLSVWSRRRTVAPQLYRNIQMRGVDDRCRVALLQEASLRSWRSTTTSQGRRLT